MVSSPHATMNSRASSIERIRPPLLEETLGPGTSAQDLAPATAGKSRTRLKEDSLEPEADGTGRANPVDEASLALPGIVGASVQGRVALGPRAGVRVRRLGAEPDLGHVASRGPPRQA